MENESVKMIRCEKCDGKGIINLRKCHYCNGKGVFIDTGDTGENES